MRPICLTLTAFGPYKDKEIIDFKELEHHRLFVVSGQTGAGKTTLFDAICFALYGEASGEDRKDTKLLRSHFASDDVHTSVELIFELRGRTFRLLRQMAHIKLGNKTATGDRYEFFELKDGGEVPCVDRQKISDINQKVEELLGLTKDQFSQIVMIPQGEFRKLLTSETENKEEILRRIFKTEPYRWINERLNTKRKEAEVDFLREKGSMESLIQQIPLLLPERPSLLFERLHQKHYNFHQLDEGLDEEIAFYEKTSHEFEMKYQTLFLDYQNHLDHFHRMKAINDEFKKWDDKKTRYQELLNYLPEIQKLELQFKRAEKASRLIPYENHANEWRKDQKSKEMILGKAKVWETKVNSELQRAMEIFQLEEGKAEQRDQLKREVENLKALYPEVKALDEKQKRLILIERSMKQFEKESTEVETQIREEKGNKGRLSQEIQALEEKRMELSEKKDLISEWRETSRLLRDYLKNYQALREAHQVLKETQDHYQEISDRVDLLERQWMEGQAGLIASKLHQGEPCPVCGSLSHPNVAVLHEAIPTKEEIDGFKAERKALESAYQKALANFHSFEQLTNEKREELKQQHNILPKEANEKYEEYVAKGKKLKQDIDQLEQDQKQWNPLKKALESAEKGLDELQKKKEKLDQAFHEKKTSYETQKALLEQSLKSIPENVRNFNELEKKSASREKEWNELDQAFKSAEEALSQAKVRLTEAKSDVKHAAAQLEESQNKAWKAEQEWQVQMSQAGFKNEADYLQAKRTKEEQEKVKQQIDRFFSELATLEQQMNELESALNGKTRANISKLEEELVSKKQEADLAEEAYKQKVSQYKDSKNLKQKLLIQHNKLIEQEQRFQQVTDLYDLIRGQNSQKISFERYLQIEYLEQIVFAANTRLRAISSGQFTLIRSDRQETHGKQSGLGLDVYDAYTGQTRDVKSLSGGEKFNASLCLALGMADIIQSYQGGVSIDTMFIDEGFGSLDEESLMKAIDTLIELQKTGRMIGVISHVQELKNTIPAILEVNKTKEGYSHTQFRLR